MKNKEASSRTVISLNFSFQSVYSCLVIIIIMLSSLTKYLQNWARLKNTNFMRVSVKFSKDLALYSFERLKYSNGQFYNYFELHEDTSIL